MASLRLLRRRAQTIPSLSYASRCFHTTGHIAIGDTTSSVTFSDAVQVPRRRLIAHPRSVEGSRAARRLRRDGWIPSVLYGGSSATDTTLLQVEAKDIRKELRELKDSFNNTLYDLEVGGNVYCVLPRQLQTHPAFDSIQNITFMKYKAGHTVAIPLRTVNEDKCIAIRRGAFFLQVNHMIKCRIAEGFEIPKYLEVDLAGADNKEVIRLTKVRKPEGVELLITDSNWCAGTVVGKRVRS